MPDLIQFHDHVKRGELDQVRTALSLDRSLLDTPNASGQSAFLLAKYYRQQAIADYLLSLSPKLDLFDTCVAGRTAEVLARVDGDTGVLTSHSRDGWTPLHLAAFFGHPELAVALLDHGANVNARSGNALRNTPLHAAAAGGQVELVALLLSRGADVNALQEGGWTALHSAAQAGNRDMVCVLLASGADAGVRAANNQAPLDLALSKGHGEVASLLERPLSGATAQ